jgi:hypothetical protein
MPRTLERLYVETRLDEGEHHQSLHSEPSERLASTKALRAPLIIAFRTFSKRPASTKALRAPPIITFRTFFSYKVSERGSLRLRPSEYH